MMPTWWISYFPLLILVIILYCQRKETDRSVQARLKRKKGDREMNELAQRFVGKDVLLTTIGSGSCDGLLREVVGNAIVLVKNGEETVVNLDYVIRLREYPKNKRGKKKIVFDA